MLRTARWSALVVATAAFMTTACRRDDSQVDVAATDSALARDITLASAVTTATPQLRDSPDSAPPTVEAPLPKPKVERKPAPPRTQPRAPEREAPKPEPPAPTPVVEDTAAAVAAAALVCAKLPPANAPDSMADKATAMAARTVMDLV